MKYVCRNHLLNTDFTIPERKQLNRAAVSYSSDSASQAPTPQLPDSPFMDVNSVPSLLSPQKNLHVQPPKRTCGKLPMSSSSIETLLYTHEDSPRTSPQICVVMSTPAAANMFAVEDTSCSLTLNASNGDFRHINHPNSSPKPRDRHYFLMGMEFGHSI
jgi:hypothetical protein